MPNEEIERIKAAIRDVSGRKPRFTADDVRNALGFEPSNPNFMGVAFRSLKFKEIRKVGGTKSGVQSRHSGHLYEWSAIQTKGCASLRAWF